MCKDNNKTKPHRVTCLTHHTLAGITQGSDIRNSLPWTRHVAHVISNLHNNSRGGQSRFTHKTATGSSIYSSLGKPINPDLNDCKVHAPSNPPTVPQNRYGGAAGGWGGETHHHLCYFFLVSILI